MAKTAYPDFIDFYSASEMGLTGFSTVHKFGRQTNLTLASFYPVWSRNATYSYLASSSALIVGSDVDSDKTGGTGAITIELFGVDNDFTAISETMTITGFAGATTTNAYRRIYRAKVTSAGTAGTNNGRITFLPDIAANTFTAAGVPTATSNVLAQIDTATSQTLMAMYTVDNACTAYMTGFEFSTHVNKNVLLDLYVRPFGEVFQIKKSFAFSDATIISNPAIPETIDAKSDIEWRARSSSTAGNVSVNFDLLLRTL